MPPHSTVSLSRRLTGWLMLLIYLAAIPPFVPASLAAAAAFHGNHSVSITAAQNHWSLVLHHADTEEADEHEHHPHHETPAVDDEEDHHHGPDHVLHFSAVSHALTQAACSVPPVLNAWLPAVICAPACPACCVPDFTDLTFARPPPGRPAMLMRLRTTVLIV